MREASAKKRQEQPFGTKKNFKDYHYPAWDTTPELLVQDEHLRL